MAWSGGQAGGDGCVAVGGRKKTHGEERNELTVGGWRTTGVLHHLRGGEVVYFTTLEAGDVNFFFLHLHHQLEMDFGAS